MGPLLDLVAVAPDALAFEPDPLLGGLILAKRLTPLPKASALPPRNILTRDSWVFPFLSHGDRSSRGKPRATLFGRGPIRRRRARTAILARIRARRAVLLPWTWGDAGWLFRSGQDRNRREAGKKVSASRRSRIRRIRRCPRRRANVGPNAKPAENTGDFSDCPVAGRASGIDRAGPASGIITKRDGRFYKPAL